MDFVEDDERGASASARAMKLGVRGYLGICEADAVKECAFFALSVREIGIQLKPDPGSRFGPLDLQVLGRTHHGDLSDGTARQLFNGYAESESSFTCAGCGDGQEILGVFTKITFKRLSLPRTQ